MGRRVRSSIIALALAAGGCASGRASPPPPEDAVRAEPLTADEVGRAIGYARNRLSGCYQRYRLSYGLVPPADFVVRLRIPSDGSPQVAEIMKSTQTGQDELELCVVEVLEAIRFPAHAGEALVVDVPIRAPNR